MFPSMIASRTKAVSADFEFDQQDAKAAGDSLESPSWTRIRPFLELNPFLVAFFGLIGSDQFFRLQQIAISTRRLGREQECL